MLIDVNELATKLNVSRKTVFNYIKHGMPVIRMSPRKLRFDYDEVVFWLKHKAS
jgi:predicted DNA-binding transcriptional regulator AlpA